MTISLRSLMTSPWLSGGSSIGEHGEHEPDAGHQLAGASRCAHPACRAAYKHNGFIQTVPFVVSLQALSGLNMVLSIGQRDHKKVAARSFGNRSSLVHDDELFLGQHHIVRVKQGFGCLELYALEWRRI